VHRIRRRDEDTSTSGEEHSALARWKAIGDPVTPRSFAPRQPGPRRHIPVSFASVLFENAGKRRRTAWCPKPRIAKRTGDGVIVSPDFFTFYRLVGVILEYLLGEEVLHLGLIVHYFQVSGL